MNVKLWRYPSILASDSSVLGSSPHKFLTQITCLQNNLCLGAYNSLGSCMARPPLHVNTPASCTPAMQLHYIQIVSKETILRHV
jgi:hypothetical protein